MADGDSYAPAINADWAGGRFPCLSATPAWSGPRKAEELCRRKSPSLTISRMIAPLQSSLCRGQTGGIAFLPSESYDTWETMPGDVYNAWMEKVSQLRVCRQPLPEAVAVWLELVLDCVKNFPKNYCIQTLRRLGQRFPRILDIRNDVLKQRDEFAVLAMPVKLGQQVYSSRMRPSLNWRTRSIAN